MSTQTKAKIMLSVLLWGGGLPTAIYFLTINQYVIYGWLVILGLLAVMVWLWKPWTWFQKE